MYKLGHSLRALRSTAVLEEEKKYNFPIFSLLSFWYLDLNLGPLQCDVSKYLTTEIYLHRPFILTQNLTNFLLEVTLSLQWA